MVFLVFGLFFIFGLLSLVIDAGWMMFQHNRLQTATQAAWKAGRDEFAVLINRHMSPLTPEQEKAVKQRVIDTFLANGYSASETERVTVNFRHNDGVSQDIEVVANVHVGLFFARVLDFPFTQVAARRSHVDTYRSTASATVAAAGVEPWIIPQGIAHGVLAGAGPQTYVFTPFATSSERLRPGDDYLLRLPEGLDVTLSNTASGVPVPLTTRVSLDFGMRTGEQIRFAWKYGTPKRFDLGQALALRPGTEDALISQALQERFARGEAHHRVVVPIIGAVQSLEPGNVFTAPASTGVVIRGFAEFDLLAPAGVTASSTAWHGRFLRYIVEPE
jgi:hypothetical protein